MALFCTLKGIPSGYNLDMQEANFHGLRILKCTGETIKIFRDAIEKMEIYRDRMLEESRKYPITTTDIAEKIAVSEGRPYREVHAEIAEMMREYENVEEFLLNVYRRYGVQIDSSESIFKDLYGGPKPEEVRRHIEEAMRTVERHRAMMRGVEE